MDDERFEFASEGDLDEVVKRFESMKKKNESYFFDVHEFENIIDYYLDTNDTTIAYEATVLASRQHPHSLSIQIRKAQVLLDRGRPIESLKLLKKIEGVEPLNYDIQLAKGTALGMLGDIGAALKCFDRGLEMGGDQDQQETVLYSITNILQNLNFYKQAIPYLHQLIKLEADFPSHMYDLAFAYEKTGELDKAVRYYKTYIEEEPYSDSAWYNLGILQAQLDRAEEAIEAYDFALAINEHNTFALFNKGNLLCDQGHYEEALKTYFHYLEEDPESVETLTYIGECYERLKKLDLAKKYYQDALELAPDFADPWFGLAMVAFHEEKYHQSEIFMRKALKMDEENGDIWFYLGEVYSRQNRKKDALRCYKTSLKYDPFNDDAWFHIGQLLVEEELQQKAIPYLKTALKLTGSVPGIHYLLSLCYLYKRDASLAFSHLEQALHADVDLFTLFGSLFKEELLSRKMEKLINRHIRTSL